MQNEYESKRHYKKYNCKAGDKFGRLTLTGVHYLKDYHGRRRRVVEAKCECGVVREFLFNLLSNGDTQSCGCLRKEVTAKRMTTHNLTLHPLYDVRLKMIERCYNPEDKAFKNYGGRNIEVWKDWQDDFMAFYDWAMANGWEEGKSLDREDNDGNYNPNNCRFVGRDVQSRNQRGNIMITAFGETKCLFDWGKDRRCKVTVWGLRNRLDRGKWTDMEKMITTPSTSNIERARNTKRSVMLTAFGQTKCMSAWLEDKRCTVKIDSLRDRLAKGWSHHKAISFPARKI